MPDPRVQALLTIGIMFGVILLANAADRRPRLRPLLYIVLLTVNLLFGLRYVLESISPSGSSFSITQLRSLIFISILVATLSTLFMLYPLRRWLARFLPRPGSGEGFGQERGFDPASMVHMLALIAAVYLLGTNTLQYVESGGLSGIAQEFETPTVTTLWLNEGLFVVIAVLSVGLGIRRNLGGIIRRLGLRAPTVEELGIAVATTIALFAFLFMFVTLWQLFVPPEVINQQTQVSQQLNKSINTMYMAFMLGASASVGEEVLFRGALQPIFGLWPTAIFFALIHNQYMLTPAVLTVLMAGLGFGWLRRRYNTTTAIVAHFLYDFTQAALLVIVGASAR